MNYKEMLRAGNIIKDSNGEYGIVLEFGIEKFISYKNGFVPFECINDNLIWVIIKDYLAVDSIYELNEYISLPDLQNLEMLDKENKMTCIWSRQI